MGICSDLFCQWDFGWAFRAFISAKVKVLVIFSSKTDDRAFLSFVLCGFLFFDRYIKSFPFGKFGQNAQKITHHAKLIFLNVNLLKFKTEFLVALDKADHFWNEDEKNKTSIFVTVYY